ncbi:MAG: hypothetical protein QXP98_07085 [Thermoproteus sp.]
MAKVAEAFGCPGVPQKRGDVVPCGKYALYLNEISSTTDNCYLGVTYSELWEEWEYKSSVYKPGYEAEAREVLCRLASYVKAAVVTPAPSVRDDTDANIYTYPAEVWVRDGYELEPPVARILAPLLLNDWLKLLDLPPTVEEVKAALERGEPLCGGRLVRRQLQP